VISMKKIYPALKAIVAKEGKILIIKRGPDEDCSKNEWDIPGGKFDFGETPLKCLKREVKEETNLEIYDDFQPVRVWSFFKNNGKTQVIGITVLCKHKYGEVKLSDEHTDFKWINPSEIGEYNIHDGIEEDVKATIKLVDSSDF